MKTFNKTLLASAVGMALASTSSYAEIELGKGLSVTGFIDMSYVYTDVDGNDTTSKVFGVDQVETNFLYKGDNGVSAQVDIEYGESGDDSGADETFVEQAFITKQVNDQLSVKAGRFLSYTGWETEEPTGLYQYSGTGYGGAFYGGYQQGVSAYYDGGAVDFMASVVNDIADPVENDTTQLAVELGVAVEPAEGVVAKLFYTEEEGDKFINLWGSYESDGLTLAAEYNTYDLEDDSEGDGYLLMANYATGQFGFTFRYHAWELEDGAGNATSEQSGITLAPSYAVSDNLLLVAEYRMDEIDVDGGVEVDGEVDTFALEALYTF